jgi:hypothetical protein
MQEQVPPVRRTLTTIVAVVLGFAALAFVGTAPAGAKGAADTARFVDVAVTPDYPDGTAVDVYVATSQPRNGGKVTALKPTPKKLVAKLAFGSATKYLPIPANAVLLVTAAGKPDILALGSPNLPFDAKGVSDTFVISHNGDPVLSDTSDTTTTTERGTYTSPLSIGNLSETKDYTYTDGTGRPIKDAAVLFTRMEGVTAGTEDDEWQMGVVGKGCLPEFIVDGNEDSSYNPEYLSPGSGGNGVGIEYVASEPGSLQLGLWPGDTTDCSGTPAASATADVTAGSRSYLFWYGPATAPKLLVLGVPQPKGEKFATNSSPQAFTGSGSSTGGSDGTGETTTSSSSTTTNTP